MVDLNKGDMVELNGEFDNAVDFKLLYWNNFVAMNPVE